MARREGAASRIGSVALRLAALYRFDLALTVTLLVIWRVLAAALTSGLSIVTLVGIVAALTAWRPSRDRIRARWTGERARRRFLTALRAVGFDRDVERAPVVMSVERTLAGHRLSVRVPRGLSVAHLVAVAEVTAAAMTVSRLRVVRDRTNAAVARVTIVEGDPLATNDPLPWPAIQAEQIDLWHPVPIGIDEDAATRSESVYPSTTSLSAASPAQASQQPSPSSLPQPPSTRA